MATSTQRRAAASWTDASGPLDLAGAGDCARLEPLADDRNAIADCETWYREQVAYRQLFRALFLRRWRLAPGLVEESLARPAFAALAAAAREALQPLAPKGAPIVRFMTPNDSGYGFEILVPWDALPPSPALELSRLRLAVDVVSASIGSGDGPIATTAPERQPQEEAKSMTPARLEPPRRWRLSQCGYALEGPDSSGASRKPAFFVPTAGPDVRSIFIIENPAAGDRPSINGSSPEITPTTFFTQTLAPDVSVCGPPFAVRRGDTVARLADVSVSPQLKVQPVKGGWLVADGPYAGEGGRFANDDCGGCLLISLRVFFVAAAGGDPVTAFDDAWLIEDAEIGGVAGRNARVVLHPDLTDIDAYEADVVEERGHVEWSRVRHCFAAEAHTFKECGRWTNVAAPIGVSMPRRPRLPRRQGRQPVSVAGAAGIANHREELPAGLRIVAEGTEHPAGHHGDPRFADPPAAHALMRCLDDDGDPERLQLGVDGVGDLRRQLLLDLQPPGEGLTTRASLEMPTTRVFGR